METSSPVGGVWDATLRLYDVATGERLNTLTGFQDDVYSVVFSPDGKTLASGSWDATLRLYDVATGEILNTLTGHTEGVRSVVFNPDGTILASGSYDDTIRLWDVATGNTLKTLTGHTGGVSSVVFSPDGTILASGSGDATIRLWDVATGDPLTTLTGHTGNVTSIAFSPDGSTLASGSYDDTIRLWDVATGDTRQTLTSWVYRVVFSPDGSTLASGSGGEIRLWDVATGERLNTLTGRTGIESVAFSPDGSTLASGGDDGTVLLWSLALPAATPVRIAADLNGDGVVNIQDLTLVAAQFGETGEDIPADVNSDGVVDIKDLVLVAAAFGEAAAAAPPIAKGDIEPGHLQATDVQQWLREAKQANAEPAGIAVLEQLLAALSRRDLPVPQETALLANYPNPFNPETWIPYQLAETAEVTVSIYASDGKLVRTLALGQLPAGVYQNRSRAAYWDGRNAQGEPVASGVYFYTLQAGDFSATRKMLIRK